MLSIVGVVASEAAAALTDRRGWLGDVRAGPELAEGDEVSLCFYHSRKSKFILSVCARRRR